MTLYIHFQLLSVCYCLIQDKDQLIITNDCFKVHALDSKMKFHQHEHTKPRTISSASRLWSQTMIDFKEDLRLYSPWEHLHIQIDLYITRFMMSIPIAWRGWSILHFFMTRSMSMLRATKRIKNSVMLLIKTVFALL